MNTRLAAVLLLLSPPVFTLEIHDHSLANPERVRLMDEYAKIHYRSADSTLNSPLMIVVHDTETATLEQTFQVFEPNLLGDTRPDLGSNGDVNVGIHFVVDLDGSVYQLLPLDHMARHVIGFNYTALGIENVASSARALTPAQLKADAELISLLVQQFPSIRYLIGHHEYREASRPHFALWRELAPYRPTQKSDPGPMFMADLRKLLSDEYGLVLLD